MTPKERYHKIKELLQQAINLSKIEQAEFLKQVWIQSPSLVGELEKLLANEEEQQFEQMQMPEKMGEIVNNLLLVNASTKDSFEPIDLKTSDFTMLVASEQKMNINNELLKKGEFVNDRYQIELEIGRGGFAVVYLASDTTLHNRLVIVKVLNKINTDNQDWVRNKFLAEIKALSKLNHPNVVTIFDYGVLKRDERFFFVMEYLEGYNLRKIIAKANFRLLSEQIISIINQISNALDAAHKLGIYHRDLKPENIMIQPLGNEQLHVKVIDFGIATVKDSATISVKTSSLAGTPAYMSPEQLEGHPCPASDIYALGVITYELLTGRVPFNVTHLKNITRLISKLKEMQRQGVIIKPSLLNASLSTEVDKVLLKALSYNPKDRYEQSSQFAQALSKALFDEKADILYWSKLCSLAQFTDNIRFIDQPTREQLKYNSQLLVAKQKQYNYPLHSRLSVLLDFKQKGHLLLIAKDIEDAQGLIYCLCPSNFVASDKLTNSSTLLPTEGLVYKYFPLADKIGRKQILAIVSTFPINLDLEISFKSPIQILTTKDIYFLLLKLQKMPSTEWVAFSTTINIA
jgi:serine/threonine protein kinase